MGLPFAGIVRVSSMAGRRSGAADFHSEEDQRATILSSGLDVVMLPSELDVSGGSAIEQRPSLLEAVEGVEQGRYAGVVVAYLSRLGRSVRHQLAAWDRVEAAGGKVVVVQEGIDTSTPTGRLYRTIMLGIAEHERDLHVERFADLREFATGAGIWQRRQLPLGYIKGEGRRLEPSADAERVRAAFDERAAGASLRSLASELGMTPQGVAALLKNRVYLGELHVGEHANLTAHPPIVSAAQFDAAQAWQARPTRSMEYDGPALLAGIARCAGCGYPLTRGSSAARAGRRQRYRYYRCSTRHAGGEVCPAPVAISEGRLDEHMTDLALTALERVSLGLSSADVGAAERAALATAEAELVAFVAAVSAADIGAEAFGEGARARRAAIDAARKDVAAVSSSAGLQRLIDGGYLDSWSGYEALDARQRNAVMRGLFERVEVRRGHKHAPVSERVTVIEGHAGLRELQTGIEQSFPGLHVQTERWG